jgi:hypothetical protein
MQQVGLGDSTSSGARVGDGDGEENWLADVGEVDWVEDPSGQRLPYRPSGEHRLEPSAPGDDDRALVQRRRAVAALVALVVVGLAIAIPVIAFGGGGGGSPVVTQTTQTTPPVTTPAATTPTSTKPPATSATTQTFKLPAGETLKLGTTGSSVTELQHALTTLGYDPGKADGSFGPTTQAAVQKFQTDKGLPADGVVGPKTAAAINEALAAKSTTG